jgi:hypothetical protein
MIMEKAERELTCVKNAKENNTWDSNVVPHRSTFHLVAYIGHRVAFGPVYLRST